MDMTPLMHAGVAALMQSIMGCMTGDWVIGGVAGCVWFVAREQTQAEYRWISMYGSGKRANMPWWGGFDWRAWDAGSILDCIVPMLACVAVWLATSMLG